MLVRTGRRPWSSRTNSPHTGHSHSSGQRTIHMPTFGLSPQCVKKRLRGMLMIALVCQALPQKEGPLQGAGVGPRHSVTEGGHPAAHCLARAPHAHPGRPLIPSTPTPYQISLTDSGRPATRAEGVLFVPGT